MKNTTIGIILAVLLVLSGTANAYQAAIEASVSKPEVGRGEGFTYKLSVIEEGQAGRPPQLEPPDLTGFSVTGRFSSSSLKVIQGQSRLVTEQEYRLSSDTPGEHTIPPARLVLIDPKTGARQETTSNPVKVVVLDKGQGVMKGLEEDIRDIKSPKTFMDKVRLFFYGMVAIVVLVFFLILGLAIYMVKRKKAARQGVLAPSAAVSLPAKDEAMAALARAELLMADPKAFYSAVVEALRQYLKAAYGIPAPEATTTEIMAEVRKSRLPSSAVDKLWAILGEADLVKFAKHTPTEDEKTRFLEKARGFIAEV